ncbi:MAG: hypothetical protein E6Q97_00805 [Desulfurellales bacterium]|nr:MAG: hypothetical protein E6Q97_00805 [Desulfurellales bacterium]
MATPLTSRSYTIPAPLGGWNARDPLDLMPETDAIVLDNLIPDTSTLRLRKGYRVHASGMGSSAVQSLLEYVDAAGTRRLLAGANGNIYNASTSSPSSLGSGYGSNKWQGVNFRDAGATSKMILVNGADTPKQYDGTSLTDATYTGITTPANLIAVTSHKSRLYFIEKDTDLIWYGDTLASTGALTSFPVGSLLRRGGYPMTISTWSKETGAGADDLFVITSSEGEILVYAGDDPSSNWALTQRLAMPIPLGRRARGSLGAESVILTEQGLVPLSSVSSIHDSSSTFTKLSDKISKAFISAVESYGATTQGWEVFAYPRANLLLVNVPVLEGVSSQQFVMNTITGAWTRFTGINASCWCLFNNQPYFGGMDGKVYQWDYGYNDNGAAIAVALRLAYNYCADRERQKRFTLARPLVTAAGDIQFAFSLDVDFNSSLTSDSITVTGSTGSAWDASPWDTSPWDSGNVYNQDWASVTGLGRCASLKLGGQYKDIGFDISAFHLSFETGGIF